MPYIIRLKVQKYSKEQKRTLYKLAGVTPKFHYKLIPQPIVINNNVFLHSFLTLAHMKGLSRKDMRALVAE